MATARLPDALRPIDDLVIGGNKGAHMNIQAFEIRPLLLRGTLLMAAILCAACSPDPGKIGEENALRAADSQDCQVLAVIAREYYRFNRTTNPPPPLKFEPDGTNWAPDCDWGRYDLAFARLNPAAKTRPEDVRFVSFKRPVYRPDGATVETGVVRGPLDGRGGSCQLKAVEGNWRLVRCEETWIF